MSDPRTTASSQRGHFQYVPHLVIGLLTLVLLGLIISRDRTIDPRTGAVAPTAAVRTATSTAPSAAPVAADGEISVGFTPGGADSTISSDTPITWLGPVEVINGEKLCLVSVPYVDGQGLPASARVWAGCQALGIAAPDPTQRPVPIAAPPQSAPPAPAPGAAVPASQVLNDLIPVTPDAPPPTQAPAPTWPIPFRPEYTPQVPATPLVINPDRLEQQP